MQFNCTDFIRAKYVYEDDHFEDFEDNVSNPDDTIHVSGYNIKKPRKFFSNTSSVFGVEFHFETNVFGFLVRYHLICAILVSLISSISFMIKPSIVPGRVGLLVTLFLVLANFFSLAQVQYYSYYNIKLYELKSICII